MLSRITLAAALTFAAAPFADAQVCVEELSGVCLKYEAAPAAPKKPAPAAPAKRQISPAEQEERRLNLSRSDRRGVQAALRNLGYYKSSIDGVLGGGSRRAIRAWQGDQGIARTGFLSAAQVQALARQAAANPAPAAPSSPAATAAPTRPTGGDPLVGKTYTYRHNATDWYFDVDVKILSETTARLSVNFSTAQAITSVDKSCEIPLNSDFDCSLVYYVSQAGASDASFRGTLPNVTARAENLYENLSTSFSFW